MPFKTNLKAARKAAGYGSQEAAARAMGVTLSTWARWEQGVQTPSLETLGLIGELLRVAPAKLLEEPGETISQREVTHTGQIATRPNTVLRQDPPEIFP